MVYGIIVKCTCLTGGGYQTNLIYLIFMAYEFLHYNEGFPNAITNRLPIFGIWYDWYVTLCVHVCLAEILGP